MSNNMLYYFARKDETTKASNMANLTLFVVAFAALFVSALSSKYKSGDKVTQS